MHAYLKEIIKRDEEKKRYCARHSIIESEEEKARERQRREEIYCSIAELNVRISIC